MAWDDDSDIYRASDWNPETPVDVDPDTGLAVGTAAAEGAALGVSLSTVAIVVAGAFVLVLLIQGLAPLFIAVPPPAAPHLADAMQDPISEDSIRALGEAARTNAAGDVNGEPALIHDPSYPTISEQSPPNADQIVHDPNYPMPSGDTSVISTTNPLWEQDLQAQRMAADPGAWPVLIEKHREIYRRLGVDPCASGFFPQGCSK